MASSTTEANKLISGGASNFNLAKFATGLGSDISIDVFKNVQGLTASQNIQASALSNPSIVDFLKSVGEQSDFASRKVLAEQEGITNYTGTAAQNTQLLGILRQQVTGGTPSVGGGV
ncbi:MAG: hypothetical protein IIC56_01775, partial [Proteobacteria bacterium]|nr:hypothetical protein [Pseudomonadota bacterium]